MSSRIENFKDKVRYLIRYNLVLKLTLILTSDSEADAFRVADATVRALLRSLRGRGGSRYVRCVEDGSSTALLQVAVTFILLYPVNRSTDYSY